MRAKEETQERPVQAAIPVAVSAWFVPGLGHLMLGRSRRALTFFVVVSGMFALGLYLRGELFPLDTSEPLTFLAGLAEIGVGLPYFAAKLLGMGTGEVTALTYENGYTFSIDSGLLNKLNKLEAYD
ncbi:MAG: DUF6677 family protein, partial [Vicinamibacteria bacterium]